MTIVQCYNLNLEEENKQDLTLEAFQKIYQVKGHFKAVSLTIREMTCETCNNYVGCLHLVGKHVPLATNR